MYKKILIVCLLFFILKSSNAFALERNCKVVAKIGEDVITQCDIENELKIYGKEQPTENERQKVLETLINRVLLTKASESEKLIEKDDLLKHKIHWAKFNIASADYMQRLTKKIHNSVTNKMVEEYLKKHLDEINPRERRVIFVDIRCLSTPYVCKKKTVEELTDKLYKKFLKIKRIPPELGKDYFELLKKYRPVTVSVPTQLTALSNLKSIWGSEKLAKKIFEVKQGDIFKFKVNDTHYKILYVLNYEGRRNENWKAMEDARLALEKELFQKELDKKLKDLKTQFNVEVVKNE